MELNFSHTDNWWYTHYKFIFGEKYCMEPIYRTELDMERQRILCDRYGDIGQGSKDPKPAPHLDVVGHRYIPAVLGCKIKYYDCQPPWPEPANLTDEQVEKLQVPDLEMVYPTPEAMRQAGILEKKYGPFNAGQNTGGLLNGALPVRGDQMLLDFYEKPHLAHKMMEVVKDTIIATDKLFRKRFKNPSGGGGVGNCNNVLISGETYREFNLKYDIELNEYYSQYGDHFGIHHDSNIDRFLPYYAKLKNIVGFDVGMDSNLELVRKYFPTQHLNIFLYPVFVKNSSNNEIENKIKEMAEKGKPVDKLSLFISDVDVNFPSDEKIRFCYEVCRKIM
ncbi:MAG: hypothetical protein L6437_11200 [Kiritimatiellae bacterium]|nr:hypothetical protein [Kiritimatiellia bacterium]